MNSLKSRLTEGLGVAILLGIVVVTVLVVLFSAFWPFHPYDLNKYSVEPMSACPGEVVEVYVSRTMQPGHYSLEVDGQWREVGTGQTVETPVGSYNIDIPPGKEVEQHVISPLYQEAPEKAGRWVFEADITLTGRVGVLPRQQIVHEKDGEALRVLSSKECIPGKG